jgi:hypothetical protein
MLGFCADLRLGGQTVSLYPLIPIPLLLPTATLGLGNFNVIKVCAAYQCLAHTYAVIDQRLQANAFILSGGHVLST